MNKHLAEPPVTVVENRKTGLDALRLTDGPYKGIIYTYGKVSFEEEGTEKVHMKFEYDILEDSGVSYDDDEFEIYIGHILQHLITKQLQENSITYTGGIDENRTEDPEQSDT
jgi:hypothetical protein